MAIPLADLLNKISDATRGRVDRTRKRISTLVWETLQQETGLLLNRQESLAGDKMHETVSVPVSLVAGLPEQLCDFTFDDDAEHVLAISPFRAYLADTRNCLLCTAPLFDRFSSVDAGKAVLKGREGHVRQTDDLIRDILQWIDKQDPVKKILQVNSDVLGAYIYPIPRDGDHLDGPLESRIELYWAVIGWVARMMGVGVEPLTAVVLIHAAAHAYTHLGADMEGHRWGNRDFADTDHALKEGLAQYFTDRASRLVDQQVAGTSYVFDELLCLQPEVYRTHVPWVQEYAPEEVTLAILSTRMRGIGQIARFAERLVEARQYL